MFHSLCNFKLKIVNFGLSGSEIWALCKMTVFGQLLKLYQTFQEKKTWFPTVSYLGLQTSKVWEVSIFRPWPRFLWYLMVITLRPDDANIIVFQKSYLNIRLVMFLLFFGLFCRLEKGRILYSFVKNIHKLCSFHNLSLGFILIIF